MAALPTTSKLNQFLDAVVAALELNVKPQSGLNLVTKTVTVKRMLRLGDFTGAAKPLLVVQMMSWNTEPSGGRRFYGTMRFSVTIMTSADNAKDEQQLLDLATDVVRALCKDETLGGLVVYTFPVEFTPVVDTATNTGYAQAAVTFESLYIWDAATP